MYLDNKFGFNEVLASDDTSVWAVVQQLKTKDSVDFKFHRFPLESMKIARHG